MLHVPGLENCELKDWSGWDIDLTPDQMDQINAKFPVNIDPEWPEGGDQNENERERAISDLKDEIAEQKNVARKMKVYRWPDDGIDDFEQHFETVENQTGQPLSEIPLGVQWAELGQILGFEELDKYLQPRDDFRGRSRRRHQLPDSP
jgi:hypothetical protein